jgi:hypothetical protein
MLYPKDLERVGDSNLITNLNEDGGEAIYSDDENLNNSELSGSPTAGG